MNALTPFHVAIPVYDLQVAKAFYVRLFQCEIGRSSAHWIDLNLYGHQFVLHLKSHEKQLSSEHNLVDGKSIPVPHYGVVLPWSDWENLVTRMREQNVNFIIEPYVRFEGDTGEQATMFLLDPSGNALEFKTFKDMKQLFAAH